MKNFFTVQVVSDLSIAEEVKSENFECHCDLTDESCYKKCFYNDTRYEIERIYAEKLKFYRNNSEFSNTSLLIAGEILLITAIIVSLTVLVTILLKFLTRVRITRGRRVNNLPHVFDRNDNRASLTSLQRTVLEKMRDRPPTYETRHNYDYRRREQNDNENEGSREMRTRSIIVPPPPPYNSSDDNSSVRI